MAEKIPKTCPGELRGQVRTIRKDSQGSASVEYSVITMIVITVLFLPLPGLDESLVSAFVTALKQFQSNSTFLMSMP